MKLISNHQLSVIFIDDKNIPQIQNSPNPDILPSSYGNGLLCVKKGKIITYNDSYFPSLAPLEEDPIEEDKYFKPTDLVEENALGTKLFGFGTPKKTDWDFENLETKVSNCKNSSKKQQINFTPNGTPTTPRQNKNNSLCRTPKQSATPCRTPRTPKINTTPCRTPRTPKINSTPCRTPRTPKSNFSPGGKLVTPSNEGSRLSTPKGTVCRPVPDATPYSFRRKVKQRIVDVILDEDEEDDFDDSDLDGNYSPEESEESDLEVSDINDNLTPAKSFKSVFRDTLKSPMRTPRRGRTAKVDVDLPASSDDYFLHNSEAQCITSDHTLNRLETPRLGPDAIKSLLGSAVTSHENEKEDLLQDHLTLFPHWMTLLMEGFSMFSCGVGSKKQLLSRFQVNMLQNFDHLVINGFFPSLTLRSILISILEDILELESHPQSIDDMLALLCKHYNQSDCNPLFLIIHNLDGPMLRSEKFQITLSNLASFQNIHCIASMDHINAPLVFDSNKFSLYNPLWWDTTTLATYSEETSYENSLLVQQSGALALSSLIHVFKSLTPNAKGIFILLAKHQLEQKDVPNYLGLSFEELYQRCRESFLVNSDLTLRAQLTEFKDHKLIKTRKGFDGVESLIIPLEASILLEFIDQQSES